MKQSSYVPPKKKRKVDRLYDLAEKQRREQLRDEREREKPAPIRFGVSAPDITDEQH
jgi:hypothetical protein